MAAKKTKKKPRCEISLEVAGEKLESSGDTTLEALSALPKPQKMTTKVIFTVTYGGKVHHEVLMPAKAKLMFRPMAQKLLARNLEFLLSK